MALADEQRKFAVRLGYREFDAFRRDYLDTRDAVHMLYEFAIRSRVFCVQSSLPIILK